jgi:hypothetical protein
MKRFEYKVLKPGVSGSFIWWGGGQVNEEEMSAELNRLGAAGWDLVSAFDTSNTTGRTASVVLLFKREISG